MSLSHSAELLIAIITAGSRAPLGATVDPSLHPDLVTAGLGPVTAGIEQLSVLGLVKDPQPLFGADGGMWIGYSLTEEGRAHAHDEGALRRAIAPLTGGARSEVTEAVGDLEVECRGVVGDKVYAQDFLECLREVRLCFDQECYIAVIALCGRLLEVCLKEKLRSHDIRFDPNAMMGQLLKAMREHMPTEYVDPSLTNIASLVNASRIPAVHAQERIPVPSRDQAVMVIFATRDLVRRTIVHPRTI